MWEKGMRLERTPSMSPSRSGSWALPSAARSCCCPPQLYPLLLCLLKG